LYISHLTSQNFIFYCTHKGEQGISCVLGLGLGIRVLGKLLGLRSRINKLGQLGCQVRAKLTPYILHVVVLTNVWSNLTIP
jgi:hypothetical protein